MNKYSLRSTRRKNTLQTSFQKPTSSRNPAKFTNPSNKSSMTAPKNLNIDEPIPLPDFENRSLSKDRPKGPSNTPSKSREPQAVSGRALATSSRPSKIPELSVRAVGDAVVTPSARIGHGAIPKEVAQLKTVPIDPTVVIPIRRRRYCNSHRNLYFCKHYFVSNICIFEGNPIPRPLPGISFASSQRNCRKTTRSCAILFSEWY
jgi:hypothetical protein